MLQTEIDVDVQKCRQTHPLPMPWCQGGQAEALRSSPNLTVFLMGDMFEDSTDHITYLDPANNLSAVRLHCKTSWAPENHLLPLFPG